MVLAKRGRLEKGGAAMMWMHLNAVDRSDFVNSGRPSNL